MKRRKFLAFIFMFLTCLAAVSLAKQPPLGDAILKKIKKMPAAPTNQEFAISRAQFAEAHWHGLEIIPMTDQIRRQFLIPFGIKGVMIDEVTMEAMNCGFLAADVVRGIEGYATPDLKEFLVASMRVDTLREATFDIYRQGKSINLTLKAASYYNDLGYANMEGGEGGIPGQKLTPFDAEMFLSVPPTKLSPQELKMLKSIDAKTGASPSVGGPPAAAPNTPQGRAAAAAVPAVPPVDARTGASPVYTPGTQPGSQPGAQGQLAALTETIPPQTNQNFDPLIDPTNRTNEKGWVNPVVPLDPNNPDVMRDVNRRKVAKTDWLEILLVILVFVLVYFMVFEDVFGHLIAFSIGAFLFVFLGNRLGFYGLDQILHAINYQILIFILGMNIISVVLTEAGLISYFSKQITLYTEGDRWKILFLFSLLAYIVSCFMDNIATILILVPMTLTLAKDLKFDPKPILVCQVVASNLGGASTMVGDFPNLLIALSTDLQFHDFIIYEMPCCLILLAAMLLYVRYVYGDQLKTRKKMDVKRDPFFVKIRKEVKTAIHDPRAAKVGLFILGLVVIGFLFSDPLGINPGIIALAGGLILLFASGIDKVKVLRIVGFKDILFFSFLFVMVGAAEASGVLVILAEFIVKIAAGHTLIIALLMMWLAGIMCAFMNAGPTAALFIPVVHHIGMNPANHLFWWALSLGVVAGSSAFLTAASGGPLTSTLVGKFWKKHRHSFDDDSPLHDLKKSISFKEYARMGIPIMLMFLIISSAYVTFLYWM